MERLEWWAKALELLGQAKLIIRRVIPPLQATMQHFKRCWSATLAMFCNIATDQGHDGELVLLDLVRSAAHKVKNIRPGARDMEIDVGALLGFGPGMGWSGEVDELGEMRVRIFDEIDQLALPF